MSALLAGVLALDDARDAAVIAVQARMRQDPTVLRPDDEHAVELRILTGRRAALNADRTRRINRLRGRLTSVFPALERTLDLGSHSRNHSHCGQ